MAFDNNNGLSSYADGIDVLFATNTFHLRSPDLLEHLPEMILPQRLRVIPSLEMCWLGQFDGFTTLSLWKNPTKEDSELHALCRMAKEAFPGAFHLDISLLGNIKPAPDSFLGPTRADTLMLTASAIESVILGPVESILRALGPGREFSITIPIEAWDIISHRHRVLYGQRLRIERYGRREVRLWKVLDRGDELGYWIRRGGPEFILPSHVVCYMGGGADARKPHNWI